MLAQLYALLTAADKILIVTLIVLSLALMSLFKLHEQPGGYAEIKSGAKIIGNYSLAKDTTFAIQGQLSTMVIEIKSGKIRVVHSDCPQKICIKTGWIKNSGQIIACVPNRVVIMIVNSRKENFLDVVTQ